MHVWGHTSCKINHGPTVIAAAANSDLARSQPLPKRYYLRCRVAARELNLML